MKAFFGLALLTSCVVDNALARPLGRHNRDRKDELVARWSEAWSYTLPAPATAPAPAPAPTTATATTTTTTTTTTTFNTLPASIAAFALFTPQSSPTQSALLTTITDPALTSLATTTAPISTYTTSVPGIATVTTNSSIPFANSTAPTTTPSPFSNGSFPTTIPTPPTAGTGVLQLALVNNLAGETVNAYVTGTDDNGNLVILQPNGQWYIPSAGSQIPSAIEVDVAIPLGAPGSITYVSLPSYISAGRIWFAEGTLNFLVVQIDNGQTALVEPSAVAPSDSNANTNWGFVELTYTKEAGLWANISYVDFVGLVLGMILETANGPTQATPGLQPGAVKEICAALVDQTSVDGQAWNELCINDSNGEPLRVLSPGNYMQLHSGAFNDYWTAYVDQVWEQYTSQPLIINTQSTPGNVSCTVQGDTLICDGDSQGFNKPNPEDIFGCNTGPFSITASDSEIRRAAVPRLCAAFNRSTLLLDGGNVQPSLGPSDYYTIAATNHYSKVVHQYEDDGIGYAFAYDDVTPSDGTPQSGELVSTTPQLLTITVGGATI